ncbi:MAG: barstar family protein [Blautia sp.]|nr:barstar family protein [Blautia sp.]
MYTVTVIGKMYDDIEQVHDFLAEELDFPVYYGKNLSALYDVLTDLWDETCIQIDISEVLDEEKRSWFLRLIDVITDAVEANEKLELEIIDYYED